MTPKMKVITELRKCHDIAKTKKIVNRTGLTPSKVGRILSALQHENVVRKVGAGMWEVVHIKLDDYYPRGLR